MKAIGIILILLIIGFVVYTQFIAAVTEEQKQVKDLDTRFSMASRDFVRALRMTAELGMDTTGELAFAIRILKKVKSELIELQRELTEELAIERADRLRTRIDEFFKANDIR